MTRTLVGAPRCRTCGRSIVGCAVTKHGRGWVADAERSRRRRGIRPRA